MKHGLLILGLIFSLNSFGQTVQVSESESIKPISSSQPAQPNAVTIEKISNAQELNVKVIERPKVSEKKQIPTSEKKEPSNN